MSQFEYLSVLVSIIIALGVTEVLLCWVRLLRHRRHIRFYWVHGIWTLLALLLLAEFWWGFWQYRVVTSWSFGALMLVVTVTVVMVVVALLLSPPREEPPPPDLRGFYYDQSRLVFPLAAVLVLLLMTCDVVVGGQPLVHPENAVRPLAAVLLAWLGRVRSPGWHGGVAVVSTGLLIVFPLIAFRT